MIPDEIGQNRRSNRYVTMEVRMIDLTELQRQELEGGKAVEVTDPQTVRTYVILRKDVYERVQSLLFDDSEWSEEELRLQLARSTKDNGWDEPGMDAYDRYDEELRKRCP